jgi:hypothetical protein
LIAALDLIAKRLFVRMLRCPDQPIPNKIAYIPGHAPCVELTGKPHDAAKRQDAVGRGGEILFLDYWNHTELDVLQNIRLIDQIDPNHISSPKGLCGQDHDSW